ncbi:MAG TPA: CstA-like transporter-associated (seleno)protein [Gemmatimonadales bacterium]|nr:CstA-like transporter-associated (seleno)protein [Gemmatimonadales bacterium]
MTLRGILRVIRRILGAPDYAAYLEHCRAAGHEVRLTEREYVREFLDNKGKAPRCC